MKFIVSRRQSRKSETYATCSGGGVGAVSASNMYIFVIRSVNGHPQGHTVVLALARFISNRPHPLSHNFLTLKRSFINMINSVYGKPLVICQVYKSCVVVFALALSYLHEDYSAQVLSVMLF